MLSQVFSSHILLSPSWTSLGLSRWSGLHGRSFLIQKFTIQGSWVSHLHNVCRLNSCISLFELNWSGYPTASQHCSHNQSRHPKICLSPFILKPVSHEQGCIIFNMNQKLWKSSLLPTKLRAEKKQSLCWIAVITSSSQLNINMRDTYLVEKEKEGPFWDQQLRWWTQEMERQIKQVHLNLTHSHIQAQSTHVHTSPLIALNLQLLSSFSFLPYAALCVHTTCNSSLRCLKGVLQRFSSALPKDLTGALSKNEGFKWMEWCCPDLFHIIEPNPEILHFLKYFSIFFETM